MIHENDCQNRREQITALLLGELDSKEADELQRHIEHCKTCQSLYQALADEEKAICSAFKAIADKGEALQNSLIEQLDKKELVISQADTSLVRIPKIDLGKMIEGSLTKIAAAAVFLIILSWAVTFVLYRDVTDLRNELSQRDIAVSHTGDSAAITLYLKEHQDVIAHHVSLSPATPQALQMQVGRQDILYYEILEDEPEYVRPGIIVRGPSSQREISLSEAPVISNGHTLSLSEAHEVVNFDFVAPPRLHPCYMLDQIRRIEGRNSLQMLYTDGINSISLFEQPLDGELGLSPQDFREYSVFLNKGQSGGTILAWRDEALSYVLISNIEMSQLMDLAQSISVRDERK
ncbi:MAG: anti-sigma factor family protein [Planctomycetota bacterium]|jgi:anti-sigma factor RsiW